MFIPIYRPANPENLLSPLDTSRKNMKIVLQEFIKDSEGEKIYIFGL